MHPEKFGRYEVLGLLGEGSMGRVYRAFDPLGHRVVAIKTVRPEFLGGEAADDYLRRFRREAQAAGALSHPSIITIFDVGSDYFVMELLEGATLQALLREQGRLALAEALRILEPVGEALDYAHARGVIHRDIKPGNLMLLPDGRTKIMDFGVAHLAAKSMSVSSQFLGSPSYMAPERILRGEATPRSDLFSFAVVAYECLTGARPFPGDNVSDVVSRVVKGAAAAPSSLDPSLPPEHDAVFHTALAKDPAERFPTAVAFMVALGWEGEVTPLPAPLPLPAPYASTTTAAPELGTLVDAPASMAAAPPRRLGVRLALAAAALFAVSLLAGYLRRPSAPAATLAPLAVPGPPVVSIETTPAGAQVFLDGREAGVSPLSLASLPLGVHTVKVTHPGYVPTELNVEVRPGTGHVPLALPLHRLEPGPPSRSEAPVRSAAPPASHAPPTTHTAAEPDHPAPDNEADEPEAVPTSAAPPALEARGRTSDAIRISGKKPRYPELARPLRQRGSVIVEMVVGETGETRDLRILQSAGVFLDEAALQAIRSWRYEPAQRDGVKVDFVVRVQLDFEPPP
jgi:eukaryotic-like serine/threonine-protein kinase